METEEIIKEVTFEDIKIKVRTFMKENPGASFNTCYDKAVHGFKMQHSYALRKFKKSKNSLGLTLRDKLIVQAAEKRAEENNRFVKLSRFEVEDVIKNEKGLHR